jgi:hypothetical protein
MSGISSEDIHSLISDSVSEIFKGYIVQLQSSLEEGFRRECGILRLQMSEMENRIRSDILTRTENMHSAFNASVDSNSQHVIDAAIERERERIKRSGNGDNGHVFSRSTNPATRSGRANRQHPASAQWKSSDTSPMHHNYVSPNNPADTVFVSYERRWGRIVYNKHRSSNISEANSENETKPSIDEAAESMLFKHEKASMNSSEDLTKICDRCGQQWHRGLGGAGGAWTTGEGIDSTAPVTQPATAPATQPVSAICAEGGEDEKEKKSNGTERERVVSFRGETNNLQHDTAGSRDSTSSISRSKDHGHR